MQANTYSPYLELFIKSLLIFNKLNPFRNSRRKIKALEYKYQHAKIYDYLNLNYVDPFLKGSLKNFEFQPKMHFKDDKIIWQLWYQGEQNASNLIKMCFSSVEKQMSKQYKIIILDENSIKDYLDFPPFVWQKIENKVFGAKTITFFSDLLRVALLSTYGGVWIDASIFLSDKIPNELLEKNFFAFERSKQKPSQEKLKQFCKSRYFSYGYFNWNSDFKVKLLSSFLISKANTQIINALRDILMNYWQQENSAQNHYYFVFQVIFELLKDKGFIKSQDYNISDIECHLLQFHSKDEFDENLYQDIKNQSFLHKLTHFRSIKPNSMIDKVVMKG